MKLFVERSEIMESDLNKIVSLNLHSSGILQ
jgi:hypothetical protein